jgi:hypothetical protein
MYIFKNKKNKNRVSSDRFSVQRKPVVNGIRKGDDLG